MKKIKIGFAGLGDHARQSHLEILLKMVNVEICCAFDPNVQVIDEINQAYNLNLTACESFAEMLDKVDAVIICSPDKYHIQQMREALEEGKHVLCEKPLATTEDEMIMLKYCFDLAKEKHLVVTSCHPRRFDRPYVELRHALPELKEHYGKVLGIDLDFSYHRPSDDKADLHGNSLLQDHANHEIDYVNFLLGTETFKAYKLVDGFDRYELVGIRDDGVSFRFRGTRRLERRIFPETIEIRFERATVHLNTYQAKLNAVYDHEDLVKTVRYFSTTDYNYRFGKINQNFIDAINGLAANYLEPGEMMMNTMMSIAFKTRDEFHI